MVVADVHQVNAFCLNIYCLNPDSPDFRICPMHNFCQTSFFLALTFFAHFEILFYAKSFFDLSH
jgi:hypothetical protein